MGFFSKKDKKNTKTHKIVTGLIVGGAVGSVLSIYAVRKKKKGQDEELNVSDIGVSPELENTETVEKIMAKKAARPMRKGVFFVLRGIWKVSKSVLRFLAERGQGKGIDDL